MRKLSLIFALFFSASVAVAQQPASTPLPGHFGAWQQHERFKVKDIPDSSGPDILAEAGQTLDDSFRYSDGKHDVFIAIRTFKDPSGAYAAFTYLRSPELQAARITEVSAAAKGRSLFLTGNILINVFSPEVEISEADLKVLATKAGERADKTPYPPIRTYLPLAGMKTGTERYSFGAAGTRAALSQAGFEQLTNEVGFSLGAETELAAFKDAKGSGTLLLIDYPTPQLAEQHRVHLEQVIAANPKMAGTVVERKGSLLSLVLQASSAKYAETLRNSVNYETQVTWNEASQTATDPPITSTLAKIFIGTGVFMVAAVVLGIAFGGVRVITKRFFPGKVFDRPENMEVLQLGLSGKPIDPTDLYSR